MRALLTTLGVLALAATASAATLKVPQQYDTIQDAVNAAGEGDTILVSKGVYYESVLVNVQGLKILGKKAVIDGTFVDPFFLKILAGPPIVHFPCLRITAAGVTVQGFTFRNGSDHVQVFAPGCRILKCISRNAASNGVYAPASEGPEVSGCRFLGAGYAGIYATGSGAGGTYSKNEVRQAGSYGIYIGGNPGAVIDRNVVGNVRFNTGIFVLSSSASITGNRVSNTAGDGIFSGGSNSTITGNRVSWASNATGIYAVADGTLLSGNTVAVANILVQCYGRGNRILGNRVSVAMENGAGFYIGGDELTVTGNLAQQIVENGSGFCIYNYSSVGGSVVEGNTAEDAAYGGFYLQLRGGTVRDCAAVRCGFLGNNAGFYVYGSGTTFESCSAVESHGDGFFVQGDLNEFVLCTSMEASINGFRVYRAGNVFTSCTAKGTGGQGFHNAGYSTVLSGGVFLDNRIDIANFTPGGATFTGGLGSVLYLTGGETTIPEVYWLD